MREHEVPTHVQAEDRVLFGFTFPQIVAVVAVCALSYGAYRYAPVGPSEVRMAIAVVFGLVGVAMVVGKIGGRRLPLMAADLLKFNLGAQESTPGRWPSWCKSRGPGAPAACQQERPRPPPAHGAEDEEGVLRSVRRTRKKRNRKEQGPALTSRMSLPSPRLVRQAPSQAGRQPDGASRPPGRDAGEQTPEAPQAAACLAVDGSRRPGGGRSSSSPRLVLADGHEPLAATRSTSRSPSRWRDAGCSSRGLTVGKRRPSRSSPCGPPLTVDIRVRAFGGGPDGTWLRFWALGQALTEGEIGIDYWFPLHGPSPVIHRVSWEDGLSQSGAADRRDTTGYRTRSPRHRGRALRSSHDLPGLDARRVLTGVVESECVTRHRAPGNQRFRR